MNCVNSINESGRQQAACLPYLCEKCLRHKISHAFLRFSHTEEADGKPWA